MKAYYSDREPEPTPAGFDEDALDIAPASPLSISEGDALAHLSRTRLPLTAGGAALSSDERRRLGAYYTSEPLARVLLSWAVRSPDATVLDPSYGGCAFLRQAIDHLRSLRASDPVGQVYGADIDDSTAQWRSHLVSQGVPAAHLYEGDFLNIVPDNELPRCSALVGNPPYVRHQRLSRHQLASYADLRNTTGLSAKASAWAYFVLHSLSFVLPGGRLALLLPGAVLHDDGYAEQVRGIVSRQCERAALVRVRQRLFREVQEETVVLLGVRIGAWTPEAAATLENFDVESEAELAELLETWPDESPASVELLSRRRVSLPSAVRDVLARAAEKMRPLGELADIRIGVVTGANTFFVRDVHSWPDDPAAKWIPVVSRASWLAHPLWTDHDLADRERTGGRTRLLQLDAAEWSPNDGGVLAEEVKRAEAAGLDDRSHSRRRKTWYDLGDVAVPDAFLPYMGRIAGRPVLNGSASTSTNAVHHLTWRDSPSTTQAFARVLSGWSSLWQLTGEIGGRCYGGGVLKLEPRAARRLPMWNGDAAEPSTAALVHEAHATRDLAVVQRCADTLVARALNLTPIERVAIAGAVEGLRDARPRRGG